MSEANSLASQRPCCAVDCDSVREGQSPLATVYTHTVNGVGLGGMFSQMTL
jgi:hypothetical protein